MGRLFNKISQEAIAFTTSVLSRGGIAILPGDTVYGFFGRIDLPKTVERLYAIKHRERQKPLVIYTNNAKVAKWVEINTTARVLIDAFWPQALSLVLPRKIGLQDWCQSNIRTQAVMTAKNPLITAIIDGLESPIFGTTVNVSGDQSIKTAHEATRFLDDVDVMIADDDTPVYNQSSTMVDCTIEPPVIIREEAISADKIREIIADVRIDFGLRR